MPRPEGRGSLLPAFLFLIVDISNGVNDNCFYNHKEVQMAVDFKKVIQELIIPELKEIKSEQKNLHTLIGSLRSETNSFRNEVNSFRNEINAKVGSLRNEMKTEVGSLRNEMNAFRNEMRAEIRRMDDKLDIALEVRERLAVLESKAAASGH